MCLAREHDLDRSFGVPQQARQTFLVAEQERRPLVRGEPAREADGHDRGVEERLDGVQLTRWFAMSGELQAQPAPREQRQLQLLLHVGVPQALVRDPRQPLPEAVPGSLVVDAVEVCAQPVVQRPDRPAQPRPRVDTVGDAQDGSTDDLLPGVVGRLGMQMADRVGTHGQAQREPGHIELGRVVIDAAAQFQDALHVDVRTLHHGRRERPDQVRIEPLVAGRDRRVDGEHGACPDLLQGRLEGHAGGH